jgi:hypothetical protein
MHFYLFPKRVFVPPPSLEDYIVGKKLVYGRYNELEGEMVVP